MEAVEHQGKRGRLFGKPVLQTRRVPEFYEEDIGHPVLKPGEKSPHPPFLTIKTSSCHYLLLFLKV